MEWNWEPRGMHCYALHFLAWCWVITHFVRLQMSIRSIYVMNFRNPHCFYCLSLADLIAREIMGFHCQLQSGEFIKKLFQEVVQKDLVCTFLRIVI